MSMKIMNLDENRSKVLWNTILTLGKGENKKKFLLPRIVPCLLAFQISCKYSLLEESVGDVRQFDISLSLTQKNDDNDRKSRINPNHVLNLVLDVNFGYVTGGVKKMGFMKRNGTRKLPSWISENNFIVSLKPLNYSDNTTSNDLSFLFSCLLLITFDSFSRSEKNALQHFTELYDKQTLCDVEFYFNNGDHVGGHVAVLAARNPVFAAMFHQMKETKTNRVDIQDIQSDAFDELLHFIYSGKIKKPLLEDTAQLIYSAADKYEIEDLKEECIDFLLANLKVENAIKLLVWANRNSVEELEEEIFTFVLKHAEEICQMEEWEDLIRNHPELSLTVTRRVIMRKKSFI